MKKITLIALAFVAFSCSTDYEEKNLKSVSIAEIAKATPELSTFVEALEITGLTETFDAQGDYTVFVPDNAAFSSLLSALGATSLADVDPVLLADVLKYHVLDSRVLSTDLTDGATATTLLGQDITVNIDTTADEVTITDGNTITSDATVIARDIKCSNGIIHRIDTVLLPNLGS
ncbi:fasciclin domain-containing protein [Flavobacterium sp. RSB2_4_14]|uniref:fasciclin domain-containing protein n=1 Tax=Flavobacterium sp. RSB2_4_14 TaxID=3447665 RepID=UPI003F3361FA